MTGPDLGSGNMEFDSPSLDVKYDKKSDRYLGHDYPGVMGNGFVQFELDELELGGRVASALDDPEQTWWNLNLHADLDKD